MQYTYSLLADELKKDSNLLNGDFVVNVNEAEFAKIHAELTGQPIALIHKSSESFSESDTLALNYAGHKILIKKKKVDEK